MVFNWLQGLRRKAPKLVLPEREERERTKGALDLKPFTPEPKVFLGTLAYLQLSSFEILTKQLNYSPTTLAKTQLSEAAAKSFEKYRVISRLLAKQGLDVTDAMDPYVDRIDVFHSRTTGIDWYENVIKVYLVMGMLDDFYSRLAAGLPADMRDQVQKALADKTIDKFAQVVLKSGMDENPQLAARLALWGRRLMGDVILEMRAVLDNHKLAGVAKKKLQLSAEDEHRVAIEAYAKLEPLVTELIGAHSLRMDALGLAA